MRQKNTYMLTLFTCIRKETKTNIPNPNRSKCYTAHYAFIRAHCFGFGERFFPQTPCTLDFRFSRNTARLIYDEPIWFEIEISVAKLRAAHSVRTNTFRGYTRAFDEPINIKRLTTRTHFTHTRVYPYIYIYTTQCIDGVLHNFRISELVS